MKATIIIDDTREEVIIYSRSPDGWARAVKEFAESEDVKSLIGYTDSEILPIDLDGVDCFITECGIVYAVLSDGRKIRIKERLYAVERIASDGFIKISKSCIANIKAIRKFDTSFAGTLSVEFRSGYRDYVSRRHMKDVKERIIK